MAQQELPLFPLNTVMFPGAPLTLHIFEDRYREMISYCLDQNSSFGVVLIRQGSEVGQPASYHSVGTEVQINASVRLEDGRMLIATTGQQRFRVEYEYRRVPYIIAAVDMLPEQPGQALTEAAKQVRSIYDLYWRAVTAATGVATEVEQLPQDAVAMTYNLAHRIQITNERKQSWLEGSVARCTRDLATMLQAEIDLLPRPRGDQPPIQSNIPWSWN